jgi:hypothetical protein
VRVCSAALRAELPAFLARMADAGVAAADSRLLPGEFVRVSGGLQQLLARTVVTGADCQVRVQLLFMWRAPGNAVAVCMSCATMPQLVLHVKLTVAHDCGACMQLVEPLQVAAGRVHCAAGAGRGGGAGGGAAGPAAQGEHPGRLCSAGRQDAVRCGAHGPGGASSAWLCMPSAATPATMLSHLPAI